MSIFMSSASFMTMPVRGLIQKNRNIYIFGGGWVNSNTNNITNIGYKNMKMISIRRGEVMLSFHVYIVIIALIYTLSWARQIHLFGQKGESFMSLIDL